jgi:hypothetical protein
MSIAEIEAENLVSDPALGSAPVPFGFIHETWLALLERLEDGDELWAFCSPPATWEHLCGRAGYVVLRDGEIADAIHSMIN